MRRSCIQVLLLFSMLILLEPFYRRAFADAQNSEAVVLYDGSGSMQGFFSNRSITNLNTILHDLLSSMHLNAESQVFVSNGDLTRFYSLSDFLKAPVWGQQTKLDDAFIQRSDKQAVVIVTDNVQDAGEESPSSTRKFYNLLEDPDIHTVLLFSHKSMFSGRLYFDKSRYSNTEDLINNLRDNNSGETLFRRDDNLKSTRYSTVWMEGEKALAVYFIFKKNFPLKLKESFFDSAKQNLKSNPLIVKPIDQERFFLKGVSDKVVVKYSFDRLEKLCSGRVGKSFSAPYPSMRLEPPSDGIFTANTEKSYQLLTIKTKDAFYTDQLNRYQFYFAIVNKTNGIVLGGHDCPKEILITLKDVEYRLPAPFRSLFEPKPDVEVKIIPSFIPDVVPPEGKIVEEDLPVFFTEIVTPPLQMDTSLKSIMRLAFTSAIPMKMRGVLEVLIPPGYFSVEKEFNDLYFTRASLDQSRIYTPEDIVRYIRTTPTTLQFVMTADNVYLTPPAWPKIVVFGSSSLFLSIASFLLFMNFSHYYLMFNDNGKGIDVSLSMPFSERVYLRNNQEVFIVRKGLWSHVLSPANGYSLTDKKGNAIPKMELKSNISLNISGPQMKTILESITSKKFSTIGQEKLNRRRKESKLKKEKSKET